MKITALTTDDQIRSATKEDLICALFTGQSAVLRDHRRKKWLKTDAVYHAQQYRDRLKLQLTAGS